MAAARAVGRVVEWKDRGFGFIRPDGGDRDVFFHASDVDQGTVTLGAEVTFEVTVTEKGQRAVHVRAGSVPAPDPEADLLSPDELWSELAPLLREAVTAVARKHNWVED